MDGSNLQSAYHNAFEDAKARLNHLIGELESLEGRRSALLAASKALEAMIAQAAEQQSASNQSLSAGVNRYRSLVASDHDEDWGWKQPLTKTYVHQGDSANEIERRIDLAIGR